MDSLNCDQTNSDHTKKLDTESLVCYHKARKDQCYRQ